MDEDLARESIRRKLLAGRLPRHRAVDIWAAPGDGQRCDGCGEPITKKQQIVWAIATRDWMSIQFHDDCFQIWDAERSLTHEWEG
jgi:hypothetical protein